MTCVTPQVKLKLNPGPSPWKLAAVLPDGAIGLAGVVPDVIDPELYMLVELTVYTSATPKTPTNVVLVIFNATPFAKVSKELTGLGEPLVTAISAPLAPCAFIVATVTPSDAAAVAWEPTVGGATVTPGMVV